MEWQPIDTAPKDGTPLLLWIPGDGTDHHVWQGRYLPAWGYFSNANGEVKPSHWMPLPPAPTGDAEGVGA